MARLIIAAVALIATVSEAFSPMNTSNPAARKVELARAKVQASNPAEYKIITDGMQMVSGGAQAEEYYEGT